jgi:serine/threonine protein phosphatase 1
MLLKPNMRTLVIGDIHGCQVALMCLLDQVGLRAEDKIIFLGDYIDRGPASRAVIDSLIKLTETYQTTFLRGNHELMMLEGREDDPKANLWQSCGGFETLASYGAVNDPNWAAKIPEAHWNFFEQTARYLETKDHIFVHACLDGEISLAEQPDWLLFWERVDRLKPHISGKRIVCGHSFQTSGEVLDLGYAVCIDTGAAYGGWLTCLDVASGRWWQANEKRRTRQGWLISSL